MEKPVGNNNCPFEVCFRKLVKKGSLLPTVIHNKNLLKFLYLQSLQLPPTCFVASKNISSFLVLFEIVIYFVFSVLFVRFDWFCFCFER